jgi:hypothetical protein
MHYTRLDDIERITPAPDEYPREVAPKCTIVLTHDESGTSAHSIRPKCQRLTRHHAKKCGIGWRALVQRAKDLPTRHANVVAVLNFV